MLLFLTPGQPAFYPRILRMSHCSTQFQSLVDGDLQPSPRARPFQTDFTTDVSWLFERFGWILFPQRVERRHIQQQNLVGRLVSQRQQGQFGENIKYYRRKGNL
jgi:hypothetical protein